MPAGRPQYVAAPACANDSCAFWQHFMMQSYVTDRNVFRCPTQETIGNPGCARYFPWARALNVGTAYGINCRGWDSSGGMKLSRVPMPSKAFYIADYSSSGGGWWRGFRAPYNTCTTSYYKEIHTGGLNIAMGDGHSESIKSARAYADTYATYSTRLPWYAPTSTLAAGW